MEANLLEEPPDGAAPEPLDVVGANVQLEVDGGLDAHRHPVLRGRDDRVDTMAVPAIGVAGDDVVPLRRREEVEVLEEAVELGPRPR